MVVVFRSGINWRNENGFLFIKVDLIDFKLIFRVFVVVKVEFGIGFFVVVYNVYSMVLLLEKDILFLIIVGSFVKDLNVNIVSVFVVVSEVVCVWNKMLESIVRKVFIFIGNI